MTNDEKLDAAINRASEDNKPSAKEIIERLANALTGTRDSANRSNHGNLVKMPGTAYQELYYSALEAKQFLELQFTK